MDTGQSQPNSTRHEGLVNSEASLLAHVHISKTAGSTLNHILRSSFGARHCPVEPWDQRYGDAPFSADDLRRLQRLYPRLRSVAGHRVFGYVDLSDDPNEVAYFALMRDPIKACASRFQHKVQRSGRPESGFDEWIEQDWAHNRHTKAISGSDSVERAIEIIAEKRIFIGLTEHFDESLLLLKNLVAPDLDIDYESVNVAKDKSVSQRLLADDRTREKIAEAQQADLELYRHVKQHLYPRYREAYGPRLDDDLARFQDAQDRSFNDLNVFLSRLKAQTIYRPRLFLHRKGLIGAPS